MTAQAAPPPKRQPAQPSSPAATPAAAPSGTKQFSVSRGVQRKAHRIGLYGTGGIGKTTLAASISQVGLTPKFLDVESGSADVDIQRIEGVRSWSDIRDALHSPSLWSDGDVIVLDTASRAEQLAIAHTLATVKTEKGQNPTSVEGYGYGKGYQHVFETFLHLFADLDRHYEAGRNVILICHDCKANVPNPAGDDYIRFEPLLQTTGGGKSSIREQFKNWCDHLFFIGYDVFAKDGKAMGSGTRTIYPVEQATFLAKSRTISQPIVYGPGEATLWKTLFGKE